jgi:hypothetical protein
MIASEQFLELANGLKAAYTISTDSRTDRYSWVITMKTYNQIRWIGHAAKAYRLPARKIRKCHMRKIARRRQAEKRRWV